MDAPDGQRHAIEARDAAQRRVRRLTLATAAAAAAATGLLASESAGTATETHKVVSQLTTPAPESSAAARGVPSVAEPAATVPVESAPSAPAPSASPPASAASSGPASPVVVSGGS